MNEFFNTPMMPLYIYTLCGAITFFITVYLEKLATGRSTKDFREDSWSNVAICSFIWPLIILAFIFIGFLGFFGSKKVKGFFTCDIFEVAKNKFFKKKSPTEVVYDVQDVVYNSEALDRLSSDEPRITQGPRPTEPVDSYLSGYPIASGQSIGEDYVSPTSRSTVETMGTMIVSRLARGREETRATIDVIGITLNKKVVKSYEKIAQKDEEDD